MLPFGMGCVLLMIYAEDKQKSEEELTRTLMMSPLARNDR